MRLAVGVTRNQCRLHKIDQLTVISYEHKLCGFQGYNVFCEGGKGERIDRGWREGRGKQGVREDRG